MFGNESNLKKYNDAYNVVKIFCQAEYQIDDQGIRENVIKYSSRIEKIKSKEKHPEDPRVFFTEADPLVVISTYTIEKIEIQNNKGIAYIKYNQLGKRIKARGTIIDENENNITGMLNLKYD